MPLTIRKEINGMPMYIHDEPNLYLTAGGQVVAEGDPRAATLLVAKGGQLAPDVAARYGLPRDRPADETERREIQPRELAGHLDTLQPGELPPGLQATAIELPDFGAGSVVHASQLPPDTVVYIVAAQQQGDQEPAPEVEFTPSAKFEEEINAVAEEKSEEAEQPSEHESEKGKVDDHVVMRQGLTTLIGAQPDMTVVGEASDGQSAVELVRRAKPDVVIMDISMPGMNGIEATRIIHAELPDVKVIGLSMFEEAERAAAMREAGAVDYLTKSGPSDALIEAIRRACVTGGLSASASAKKAQPARGRRSPTRKTKK